ncbi:SusC/RagA family TonB-linked outer membrane protein [Fulvitalea axinellae]|uniref:SusC/RagA family TonB-linked outer membrane protein n=1 Tax=Fulvitalea axinellae TaxID=1182444 RepID=A0AAU9DD96_9BACT|nr:SusC/RagA family TonB-linked outer membrane protein [Fulvitalea axinellae]
MKKKLQVHSRGCVNWGWRLILSLILLQGMAFGTARAESAYAQEKKFSIAETMHLKDLFKYITDNSEFNVFFGNEDIPKLEVTVKVKDATVHEVLGQALKKTNLYFVVKDKQVLIKKKAPAKKQEKKRTVSGTVKDENGEGVPGASVMIKGTETGTTTDFDGKFVLEVKDADVLQVSFVGYLKQDVQVGNRSVIDVALEPSVAELEEIVVVGYGVQKKSDLTGSVTTITPSRMEGKPNANFSQALQGALPGVTISVTSSSAEGGNTSLLLRGRNSINASNDPLIVLDGIPFSGGLSDINTADIESINVLKDASSTAIYGSRGANGVILITTKKGTEGKPTISYSGYYAVSKIGKMLDVYNGPEYAAWKKERFGVDLDPFEQEILDAGEWIDWQDEVTQTGVKQEHNLSIRGGTENTKYFVSGTYFGAKGIAINDEFERFNLRINLDQKIFDWLTYSTNNQLTHLDRSGLPVDIGWGYKMNPLTKKYDERGSYTIYPWETDTYFKNPFQPTLAVNDDLSYRVITNNIFKVDMPYVEGLSYKLNTGIEIGFREQGTYWGRDTWTGVDLGGKAETSDGIDKKYLIENIVSYVKSWGKHNFNFTGLYSYQYEKTRINSLTASNFPNDVLTYYEPKLGGLVVPEVEFRSSTLLSQMGRLNYGYDDRYMATFTVRRDGYSGFGDDEKYGVFPSVALGWNIHNESFFDVEAVSNLKLRLSHGKSGNQAVGPYDNLAKMSVQNFVNGGATLPGFVPANLANDVLSWESTTTTNIGVDFGLFQGKIQGTLDVYKSNTEDLLFARSVPSSHGFTTIIDNIGETENMGIELGLKAYVLEREDFSWFANVNMSANKNKIVALEGGYDKPDDNLFIGEPIRVNYGYVFDGVWQQGEDIANSAQPNAVPGDVKLKDVNGDNAIGSEDRQIQGQLDPTWTWGMENTFTYKNFSLYVFMHGVNGVTKHNNAKLNADSFQGRANTNVKTYWTPENPINSYPRNHENANIFKAKIFESANFVRVKDITLSYTLNPEVAKRFKMQNLKIYATGRNLFTITDWDGMDPEINGQLGVPLQEEYVLGVQLSF